MFELATDREQQQEDVSGNRMEIEPDDELWFNQGYEQAMAGDLPGAIASWDKVLAVKPDNDSAWYNRGIVLMALGRNEEVLNC